MTIGYGLDKRQRPSCLGTWQRLGLALAGIIGVWGGTETAIAQSNAVESPSDEVQQLLDGFADEPDIGPIQLAPPIPEPSIFRFLVGVEYRGTDNVNFDNFVTSPQSDGIVLGNIGFVATPAIAERARLVASISGGLARFSDQTDLDFNRISGSVGINWDFDPTFVRVALQAQNIDRIADGASDYDDFALQFQLGQNRDFQYANFPRRTSVSYFYQLRAVFHQPADELPDGSNDLSRVSNSFNVLLRHPITSRLQGRLGYRLALDSYTNDRTDTRNRVSGELRYALSRDFNLRGFVSYTNNESNNNAFRFDALSYGVGIRAGFSL
ncbi:MAG: outer membrane beta-barrel protein [Cyanobacteria bacterium J06639_1]